MTIYYCEARPKNSRPKLQYSSNLGPRLSDVAAYVLVCMDSVGSIHVDSAFELPSIDGYTMINNLQIWRFSETGAKVGKEAPKASDSVELHLTSYKTLPIPLLDNRSLFSLHTQSHHM